jgi:hypothetical protein
MRHLGTIPRPRGPKLKPTESFELFHSIPSTSSFAVTSSMVEISVVFVLDTWLILAVQKRHQLPAAGIEIQAPIRQPWTSLATSARQLPLTQ